jgi:F-type H+-transporting ATPase subunit delta
MQSTLYSSEIAEPYAQALMAVAIDKNETEAFGRETRDLLQLLEESEELKSFIQNPTIAEANKKAVLQKILGKRANVYLSNFLMLLVDKRRIALLPEICEKYLTQLRKLNNVVLAEVTSVKELTEGQREAVREKVKQISGAQSVELKTSIDSDILGGIIIKVGSQVVDASLSGQLRRIGYQLSGLT